MLAFSTSDATLDIQSDTFEFSNGTESKPTIADAPRFKAMLVDPSSTEQTLIEATKGFRRILSVEKNIPAQELVDSGIVPYLVRNLSASSAPLIFESAWALTNIASTECTKEVVRAGCVKPLVELLLHPDANIREQAAWCLGNIAGEGPDFRDIVLKESALNSLYVHGCCELLLAFAFFEICREQSSLDYAISQVDECGQCPQYVSSRKCRMDHLEFVQRISLSTERADGTGYFSIGSASRQADFRGG